jgi:uncharacterized membrane protein YraQ (UPF0718 family)
VIKKLIKRYMFFIGSFMVTGFITLFSSSIGGRAFNIAGSSFRQMFSVLPPIMILLGLMDVWIPREKMMKFMGPGSGIAGIVLSIVLGSLAAGPMYAAFPFTAVLLKKGVKFSNIIIFMSAWCVTKIPTFLFELAALGARFTFTRLLINLPGMIIMGWMIEAMLSKEELRGIYTKAE